MQKTEVVDDFITVQFFDISIDIIIKLSAHLYAALCSRIAVKINECLIQTLLNAESEINIMSHKIAEICDIPICCKITFKMQTADSRKMSFYNYAENVEVKIADVTFILSIFIMKGVENELILKCFWEWAVEANTFSQADESVE